MPSNRNASLLLAFACLASQSGCALWQKRAATAEPPFMIGDQGAAVITPAPAHQTGFVARHPLLSKPGEVYQNTNHHGVVKVAAATVIGIPWGILGETKQIICGCDPACR